MNNKNSISSVIRFTAILILIILLIFQNYDNISENFQILSFVYFLGGIFFIFIAIVIKFQRKDSITKKDKRFKKGVRVVGQRELDVYEIDRNRNESKSIIKSAVLVIFLGLILLVVSFVVKIDFSSSHLFSNKNTNEISKNRNIEKTHRSNTDTNEIQKDKKINLKQEKETISNLNPEKYNTPFYIINVKGVKSEQLAKIEVIKLQEKGSQAGYLWIPDYASLSNAQLFSVFIGPFETQYDCEKAVEDYRKVDKDAYGLLVSHENKRVEIRGIGKVKVIKR